MKKLVFSSSAAIYGDNPVVPKAETMLPEPKSPYAITKLDGEFYCKLFTAEKRLQTACLRYFNASGARGPDDGEDHHPETHIIPLVLKTALGERGSISVFGSDYPTPDGTCVRDYVHVDDLARAHLLAMGALDERPMLYYNLGNAEGFSVRQVIAAARDVTGHPIPVVEAPRRPGDPAKLVASSARIREELGWRPEVPVLKDIIASAWEWHRRHPGGYDAKAKA